MGSNILYKLGKELSRWVFETLYDVEVFGAELVPKEGAFLLASNHVSLLDPFIGGGFIKRDIHYFARKSLFKKGIVEYLLKSWNAIPVDRGGGDVRAMKEVLSLLKGGEGVMIFPEGTRGGSDVKKGVGMMAVKTGVPVVPMRIEGAEEIWGKDMKWPKLGGKLKVFYGRPEVYVGGYEEVSERIMEAIKGL